jgi:muramoyltetrapeptide carboxypeptidase
MTLCSITPKNLKPGSRIAIVSPAGAVSNPDLLTHTHNMIIEQGYTPVYGEFALARHAHHYTYAGTPEQRLRDLQWALDDDSIDAIWATRGGYGSVQLLEHIDLSRFVHDPKWLIGYSDITFLQSLLARHGIESVHGQNIISTPTPSADSYQNIFNLFKGIKPTYQLDNNLLNEPGSACATLIGGNMTVVTALSGTRFNFNYDNAILFLEEIGENAYYKIDRYLKSLEQTGAFEKIKGLIIGGMKNIADDTSPHSPIAQSIIAERVAQYSFPKVFGFPNGHIPDMRPLIIGGTVSLRVDENGVRLAHL